jgi:hypothetical protein
VELGPAPRTVVNGVPRALAIIATIISIVADEDEARGTIWALLRAPVDPVAVLPQVDLGSGEVFIKLVCGYL